MGSTDFSSVAALSQAIEGELGGLGGVAVELKAKHYERAISKAVGQLNTYKPAKRSVTVSYTPAQQRYELDLTKFPNLMEVVDVAFIRPDAQGVPLQLENPFLLQTRLLAPTGMGLTGHGEYAATLTHLKEAERVFSIAPDWRGVWETVTQADGSIKRVYALYLYTTDQIMFTPYMIGVTYTYSYTMDSNPLSGLQSIPVYWQSWVKEYACAVAKRILGRIRSKFKGIPGSADGSIIAMDGDELLQESADEIRDLHARLDGLRRQLPPIIG